MDELSAKDTSCQHGRPQDFFQGGGANLWGAQKKSVKGAPIFFRQALKYAYRGRGGGRFDARIVFLGDPKSIKVDF